MRNLEPENYFGEDYFSEDYGDIMNAYDIAMDASVREEVIGYLVNDPDFYSMVINNANFLDKVTKNSAFLSALASSSKAMQNIAEDGKVIASLAHNGVVINKIIETILKDEILTSYVMRQDIPATGSFLSTILNNVDMVQLVNKNMNMYLELVGDDGATVSMAESRLNPDGKFEYFFDPIVARNNPNAKIRIAFAKS